MADTEISRTLAANRDRFLAFVRSRVGNDATAEEILQAAFLKGLEAQRALRDDETAVARVDLEGMSVPDIARQSGITPNNAAVRLHRARQALRSQVERVCRTCATHGCIDCTCQRAR